MRWLLVLLLNKCSTDLNLMLSLPLPQFAADDKLTIIRTCSPVDKAEIHALSLRKTRAPTQTPALQNKLKQTGLQNAMHFLCSRMSTHTHAMLFFPFYSTMQLASILTSETVACNDCRLQGGGREQEAGRAWHSACPPCTFSNPPRRQKNARRKRTTVTKEARGAAVHTASAI